MSHELKYEHLTILPLYHISHKTKVLEVIFHPYQVLGSPLSLQVFYHFVSWDFLIWT